MGISMRFAVPQDVPACVAMVPLAFGCSHGEQQNLVNQLQLLLLQGRALCAVVVNDADEPLAFGLSVFISDEVRHYLLNARFIKLLCRELRFHAYSYSVLGGRTILRQHCGEGLNMVGFYGWRNDLPDDQIEAAKVWLYRSFPYLHRGYHLKSFLKEVYGEQEQTLLAALGYRVYREPACYQQADQPFQPYLVGAKRGEVCFPARLAEVFQSGPPPVKLTARQRIIGQMAYLMRMDDRQIAECLCVNEGTIYNAWHRLRRKLEGICQNDNGRRGRSGCLQIIARCRELIYPLQIHTLFYCKPNLARQYHIPLD